MRELSPPEESVSYGGSLAATVEVVHAWSTLTNVLGEQ